MDIYMRLKKSKEDKRVSFLESLSHHGDSNEILSYINNMAVLCPEGKGFLNISPEIRFDERFLVLCWNKRIQIYHTENIKFFCFAFSLDRKIDRPTDNNCRFFFSENINSTNYGINFLNNQYAERLSQAFNQYVNPFEVTESWADKEYIQKYKMDVQSLTFEDNYCSLFKPVTHEKIMYQDILSCSIRYITSSGEGDGADQYYLVIYLRDGSYRIFNFLHGVENCYRLAKTIQCFAPHLRYQLI